MYGSQPLVPINNYFHLSQPSHLCGSQRQTNHDTMGSPLNFFYLKKYILILAWKNKWLPSCNIVLIWLFFYLPKVKILALTTRKTSSCGGPTTTGAKTAAIYRLLRRIFCPPLYMRSIAAFFVTAAIGRVFCGIL